MDTVFAADHPFQSYRWTGPGVLNGPGVADMKGGLAIMLTALQAVERSPAAAAIGYEVVINSDEEVSSLGSAPLIAAAARGKAAAFTYEPARSEEHTSELQSLMRISYAVFCLKNKNNHRDQN